MTIPESQSQIRIERCHFAVRLNLLQFPLDEAEIEAVLKDANYTRSGERPGMLAGLPPGLRVTQAGHIANSSDRECMFSLFPDRGILAIQGNDIDRVIADLAKIQNGIRDRYVPDWENKVSFYEFILDVNARVGPDRNPIEEMKRLHGRSKLFQLIGSALGISATTYGLRLVEKGRAPDENTWIEYRVEPDVGKPKTDYAVNIVYRHSDRERVMGEARQALQKITSLVDILGRDKV